jgi:uncharacterized repeat protein (TIGR03803 family)
MSSKKLSLKLALIGAMFAAASLLVATHASAQTLHSFGSNTKLGVGASDTLVFDTAGNLYGTTADGGADDVGIVFELSPLPSGIWTEKVLHSFSKHGGDGQNPNTALIFDSAGNLYGTTGNGGTDSEGTVFELSPPVPPATQWTEKVLYSFLSSNNDGQDPVASLVSDSAGNLYGVTLSGGTYAVGTAFELSPATGGTWTETIIHNFANVANGDGSNPRSNLIFDSAGNLYGVTLLGGVNLGGTVFELSPAGGGAWNETILWSFGDNSTDGGLPVGALTFDSAGNLYGTTADGGPTGGGSAYELSPSSGGSWTETILHFFEAKSTTDGYTPFSRLTFDSAGNLYGTTFSGGQAACKSNNGCGTVFELTPTDGSWTEKVVHYFTLDGAAGYSPSCSLIMDSSGNLYGTNFYGGKSSGGTAFKLVP